MQLVINIDVDDLERGVRFYVAGLGLRLERRLFGGRVAELRGGGALVHLLHNEAGSPSLPGGTATRSYGRHWTPVHLDVQVDDLDRAVERAVAAGARLERPIEGGPWGRIAGLADPFGHGFCLVELSASGYDAAT